MYKSYNSNNCGYNIKNLKIISSFDMINIIKSLSSLSYLSLAKRFNYKGLSINDPAKFSFCKVKLYVTQFQNIQIKVKEQELQLKQLTDTYNLLQSMSHMTFFDYIRKLGNKIVNSHDTFQSNAFKRQQKKLIESRNILEKKIQESSQKWQQPRNKIMQARQQNILAFLKDLIDFQTKLFNLVQKIKLIGNKNDKVKDIHEGIQLTHQLLIKNLTKQGAEMFNCIVGNRFNPIEQQIGEWQKKSQEQKQKIRQNGKIKSCIRYGWRLKEQIMRKAFVEIF